MAHIPAPAHIESLRDFLHRHRLDAERLHFLLGQYIDQIFDTPLPVDMLSDPMAEHRLWAYRTQLRDFVTLIEPKAEQGNGDENQNDDDNEGTTDNSADCQFNGSETAGFGWPVLIE